MRHLILGAVAALAINGPGFAQDADAWFASIAPKDWTYLGRGQGGDMVVFTRGNRNLPNGHRLLWSRYEYRTAQENNVMSYVELDEYDCDGGRQRKLQRTYFGSNNLAGSSENESAGDWGYPIPGTFGDYAQGAACRLHR